MKVLAATLIACAFVFPHFAQAQSTPAPGASSSCDAKAIGKNGKPLAGAAKNSFMKKCEADARVAAADCDAKAVSKDGKKLAGAAKASSVKKCEADARKG